MKNMIIRVLLFALTLTFLFNNFEYSDFILTFLLLIGLILNYKQTNESKIGVLSDYLFWIVELIVIAYFKKIDIFIIKDSFLILFVLKIAVLLFSYLKYRNMWVTSTVISKIWVLTLFMYLSEIIINTTQGLKSICFLLGVISVVESFIIIFKNDKLKEKSISFW